MDLLINISPMENAQTPSQPSSNSSSKTLIIVVVIIILIILGIFGFMTMGNKSSDKSATQNATGEETKTETSGSVFSSIKDALSRSMSLECTYTDDSGRKSVTYIKNGAVRSDFTAENTAQSGSMIMKDNKMYFWNGKEGMMMEFDPSAMTGEAGSPPKNVTPGQQKPEDVVGALEKFKEFCKNATVSDSLFTPPADVEFTDVASMTKGMPAIPTGGTMTQEQIEALQKQYQQ